ncbi:MAG TPA: Gfo/Idh/MocA family oxidoreductase [Pirellulaceae bacterium]|nr:Gfo/Idh/MocA family oxidoreductase [Pirellulaceae bacterium]
MNRRDFLNSSATFVTAAALASAAKLGLAAAGEPLNVAVIGPGGMGSSHLRLLSVRKDLRVAYVCDVDANRLAAAAKVVEQNGGSPKAVKDLRQVLDDKSVDAVWIATPDHWHSPAAILAVEAGKHVYVEKPMSHNVREGRLLVEAARRNKKVVQVGTQSRSTPTVMRAMEIVKSGQIGDVLVAKAWNSQLRGSIGKKQPSTPPPHLDFGLWLGPAPERPYQDNLLHGIWRWWYDFGAGDIGNDGVHDIDIARWGLGVTGAPSTVAALGSKFFFDDDQQFPDTQYCVFEWPGDGRPGQKRQLIFEQRDWSPYVQEGYENGAAFYGTKGLLVMGHTSGFQVFGPRNAPGEKGSGGVDLPAHHQNFLDCIKNGGRPAADAEEGHQTAVLVHLANIACRVQRTLHLDPAAEKIVGDDEAQKLIRRTYRDGHWAVPKGV